MAIVMTFTGQVLLQLTPHGALDTPPFFPFGIWVMSTMVLTLVPILTFKGRHLRYSS